MKARYILFALLAVMVVSCQKVTDFDDGYVSQHNLPNSGAPVISAVYAVADAEQTIPLTEAVPGQRIAIVGKNLNNLRSLKFNGVSADLSQTFTQLTKAVVQIPTTYSKAHDNVIEYTTDQGTATYGFAVALPEAEVYGLQNEFAEAGSTAQVSGKNLQYYDFTLKLNGETMAFTDVTDTQLTFNIPKGTADNSVFTISWVTPQNETKTVTLPFRPTNNLLFSDLSQTTQQQTDKNVTVETSDQGTACLHFQGLITAYSWVELSFAQTYEELYDASTVTQYNFVFEVQNTAGKAFLGSGYEIAWNWDWNNSYRWNPGDGNGLDTKGEWQTVRCPLEEMAPYGLGTSGKEMVLNIGFQPDCDYEADFYMANFRIEKK